MKRFSNLRACLVTSLACLIAASSVSAQSETASLARHSAQFVSDTQAAAQDCAAQAMADPQIRHRNMVVEVFHPQGGSVEVPGNPIKLSETSEESFTPPPLLGAHTREVFTSWTGMSAADIDKGLQAGAIA